MRETVSKPWWTLTVAVLLAGCGSEPAGPRLEALLPARGEVGSALDLVGERLRGSAVTVSFGGTSAEILLQQEQRVRARVPEAPPGLTLVVITVDGRPSDPLTFEVEGSVSDGGT